MKKILVALALSVVASTASALVAGSSHDFSGPGSLSSCSYCHAPHYSNAAVAAAPLWNRDLGTTSDYTRYTGGLGALAPTSVNAASLTCLSCHDNRTAIGNLYGANEDAALNATFAAATNIGTNLADDHPVSIVYADSTFKVALTTVQGTMKLYGASNNMLECASCHDPHDVTNAKFLRAPLDVVCARCHVK